MLGDDVQELSISVERVSPDILHCKIGAPGRWEVPKKVFKVSNITGTSSAEAPCSSLLLFVLSRDPLLMHWAVRCRWSTWSMCHCA